MGHAVDIVLFAVCAGLAWLNYGAVRAVRTLRGQIGRHERMLTQASIKLGELRQDISTLQKVAPVNLAAEVVSLGEQVSRLRATHQRFQGRFDKYVALESPSENGDELPLVDDPKWHALMQLQRQSNGGS